MPTKPTIIDMLKTIRGKDLVYPGIFFVFLVIVGIVFYSATHFISQNISNIFSTQGATNTKGLELERYQLIAKKLNIQVVVPSESGDAVPSPEATVATPEQATIKPEVLDKAALLITITNSTTKPGLASLLAKDITAAGFTAPKTATQKNTIATTTLILKESKKSFALFLLPVISAKYPSVTLATTTESAANDALIIIGRN